MGVVQQSLVQSSTGVKEYNVHFADAILTALPTLLVYIVAGRNIVGATDTSELRWVVIRSVNSKSACAKTHRIAKLGDDIAAASADPCVRAIPFSSTSEKQHGPATVANSAENHDQCKKQQATSVNDVQEMVLGPAKAAVVGGTKHTLRSAGKHCVIRNPIALRNIVRLPPVHLPNARSYNTAEDGAVIANLAARRADIAEVLLEDQLVSAVSNPDAAALCQGVERSRLWVWAVPPGAIAFSDKSFARPFIALGLKGANTVNAILLSQAPAGEIGLIFAQRTPCVDGTGSTPCENAAPNCCAAVKGAPLTAPAGQDEVNSMPVAKRVLKAASYSQRQNVNFGEPR